MDEHARIEHSLPKPIDEGPSPLLPRHLVDLFLRPRSFFTGQLALGRTPYAVLVAWCYGASQTIDRLDQNLLRAELGRPRSGWDEFAPYVVESWLGFWALLLVFGALSGLLIWWIGGWWFALRLRWSGASQPDRRLARLVMVYSAFIHSSPAIVTAAIYTLLFPSYSSAFAADEYYSLVLLLFPFWSIAASYTGARALFGLSGWRVRTWFLILPVVVYLTVFGGLVAFITYVAGASVA